MSEQRLLVLDLEPTSDSSTSTESGRAEKFLWTRSDNSFRFDFSPEDYLAPQEEAPEGNSKPSPVNSLVPTAFTGQDSVFAFNFQIPPVAPEDMKPEPAQASSAAGQNCILEGNPSKPPLVDSPSEPLAPSQSQKKKKKSGKKKTSDSTEAQQKPHPTEGSQGDEGDSKVMTAEEQLKRELDWCIEQLELGMRTQKGTPKQMEEASRALKTLRSSKAPLVKKRQVMRAMTGDYRRKMEEEKERQFKLIQGAISSAQVKAMTNTSKTSVFHRRATVKPQTPVAEESERQAAATESLAASTREPTFVFTSSKEEFRFNFL